MRINCPNCEAQYEVEDRLIPEGGRDVQCSNCGHAWFQHPAGGPPEEEDDLPLTAAAPAPAPPPEAPRPAPAAAAPPPPRPPLDESLRAVLREEAEREAAARAAEARGRRPSAPVETQPDLGLDAAPRARAAAPTAPPRAPRREALPDVEAINSTLGGPSAAALPPVAPPGRSGGFVQGFAAVLLVAMLLYALYAFAPRIGAAVPALAGPLGAYTAAVDAAHRALAAALRGG